MIFRRVLIVEGRHHDTIQEYRDKNLRNWGDAWRDLFSRTFPHYQAEVKHFKGVTALDLNAADLVVFCGSGMNIYNPNNDMNEYLNVVLKTLDRRIPIIGSCFGMQAVCHIFGHKVVRMPEREFGVINVKGNIFNNRISYKACASHNDHVQLSNQDDFSVLASSDKCIQVVRGHQFNFLGLQHHPEWIIGDIENINVREQQTKCVNFEEPSPTRYTHIERFIKGIEYK